MLGPVQSDKARALTDVGSIEALALKTCKKITIDVLLQDGKKDDRSGDLAKAPVSQKHLDVFRLCKLFWNATHLDASKQLTNQLGDEPQSSQPEKLDTLGSTGSAGGTYSVGSASEAGGSLG